MIVEQIIILTYDLHDPVEFDAWFKCKKDYKANGYKVDEDSATGVAEHHVTQWLNIKEDKTNEQP